MNCPIHYDHLLDRESWHLGNTRFSVFNQPGSFYCSDSHCKARVGNEFVWSDLDGTRKEIIHLTIGIK